jgi:glycosyltransferase involved in cell wall biosynthesis
MQPFVSVVSAFLNAERFLAEAIDSVLAQTWTNWELLLVDDGSFDTSTPIAQRYAERYPDRIRYLEHPCHENRGTSPSRNLGIQHAKGEFIAFIDADDVWMPSKLADQVDILMQQPEIGMVCGTVLYWQSWSSGEDTVIRTGHIFDRPVLPPEALLNVYPLGTASAPCPSDTLLRADVLRAVGAFEEEFTAEKQLYEDQVLFSKLYLVTPVYFSTKLWLKYRLHADSCMSKVMRSGKYDDVRYYFLRWLEAYLSAKPSVDPRVVRTLNRSLWRFRRPHLYFALNLLRRALRKLSRIAVSRPA